MPTAPADQHAEPRPRLPLSGEQRAIVDWRDGPLVVITGAGTGKTRVIVERIAHLLRTQPELQPGLCVLAYDVKTAPAEPSSMVAA
jgi:hypothetical protein